MTKPTRIFVNPSGQRDNLGDSVLRRAYLDALRRHGELHVYVGTDAGYISGLGVNASDIRYASKRDWLRTGLASRRHRTVFAFNAGEYVLDRRFLVNSLWHSAFVAVSRLSGGGSVALGIALRAGQPGWARQYLRGMLHPLRAVTWRDPDSKRAIGTGSVVPDWAFALGTDAALLREDGSRDVIAVALRGDRPFPGEAWLQVVRTLAEQHGAEVVVVNQMQADAERCAELAAGLGGRVLDWSDASHAEHEEVVRALYRRSIAVVSDRIHALILGLTEGAVPVGFTTGDPEKVRRTFAALTDVPIAFAERDVDLESALEKSRTVLGQRDILLADLERGRRRLERLASGLPI